MSEPNETSRKLAEQNASAPWRALLGGAQESAIAISETVMTDMVLAESVSTAVSDYVTKRDELTILREQFADADTNCANLRNSARKLMHTLGVEFDANLVNLGSVDSQLAASIRLAAEKAKRINKERSTLSSLVRQLLETAIDEIALCASIALLRQPSQFRSEGEAFCIAFIATSLLRERQLDDMPSMKAVEVLSDWLQFATGAKSRGGEFDIYLHSRVAATIGRNMGIENSSVLCAALLEAATSDVGHATE